MQQRSLTIAQNASLAVSAAAHHRMQHRGATGERAHAEGLEGHMMRHMTRHAAPDSQIGKDEENFPWACRPRLHAVTKHLAHHRQLHSFAQVHRPAAGYIGRAGLVRQRDMVCGHLCKARRRPADIFGAQHAE